MDRSRFLAGLIGPSLVMVAAGMALNLAHLPVLALQMADSWPLIMFAGVISLVTGLAVVRSHDVWKGWPAIITVFGWLLVFGGGVRILFPSQVADIAPTLLIADSPLLPGLIGVTLILGLYLSWQAYRPVRA